MLLLPAARRCVPVAEVTAMCATQQAARTVPGSIQTGGGVRVSDNNKVSEFTRSILIMIGIGLVAAFAKEDSVLWAILYVLMMIFIFGTGGKHE